MPCLLPSHSVAIDWLDYLKKKSRDPSMLQWWWFEKVVQGTWTWGSRSSRQGVGWFQLRVKCDQATKKFKFKKSAHRLQVSEGLITIVLSAFPFSFAYNTQADYHDHDIYGVETSSRNCACQCIELEVQLIACEKLYRDFKTDSNGLYGWIEIIFFIILYSNQVTKWSEKAWRTSEGTSMYRFS